MNLFFQITLDHQMFLIKNNNNSNTINNNNCNSNHNINNNITANNNNNNTLNNNYNHHNGKMNNKQTSEDPYVTSILSHNKTMDYVRRNSYGDISRFYFIIIL